MTGVQTCALPIWPRGWGMCGGNFIRIETFEDAYHGSRYILESYYQDIYNAGLESIGFMDTIMTVLLWMSNKPFTDVINEQYSERNPEATIFHDRSKRNSTKVQI